MKKKNTGRYAKAQTSFPVLIVLVLVALGVVAGAYFYGGQAAGYKKFETCNALAAAFEEAEQKGYRGGWDIGMPLMTETADAGGAFGAQAAPDYSTTNIQVEGVDEADIVKTDGQYIYTLSTGGYRYYGYMDGTGSASKLVIASAYPAESATVLSETDLDDFYPLELFIEGNKLMVFGSTYSEVIIKPQPMVGGIAPEIYPYPRSASFMTIRLFDITDRSNPELVRSVDFEGNYVSSRKIGNDVYFVVNSYPLYYIMEEPVVGNIVPVYRDRLAYEIKSNVEEGFTPECECGDVGYFEPIDPQNFVTIASISISDANAEIKKEVIVGSGQNIYASLQNLYIAETNYPYWDWGILEETAGEEAFSEKSIIHKFGLSNGNINYAGNMEAPGRILNQFSMDEHNGYFRIATTVGQVARTFDDFSSSNSIYIFNSNLVQIGSIEDIAPGEQIYSARFMGDRGYLVTFKKIDPFFVIDLSVPENPKILGKLKIPGYSDYLHPYDENHIIGIGKDTVEAEEEWGDFAWYQGVKMAIFDVTDVSNPTELHKVIIGDRGTQSEALNTHKAFLFDREKNLLVIPITLAEIPDTLKEGARSNSYGDYVFQGAYVYDISLANGFVLKGRVTHYEDDEAFKKSGYYWSDTGYNIKRSLYIGNVLYTISNKMIKASSLADLAEIKKLEFGG